MKVILDTNVLLSALMVRGSMPDVIYKAWLDRQFDLVCCEKILGEIREVSKRPALMERLKPSEVGALVNAVRQLSLMHDKLPSVDHSRDPNDDFLLALSRASGADYLVTGDKNGLLELGQFEKTRIVTVRQFIAHIKPAG